ncbi:hypothetical protein NDU88_003696 [Pleurodeles waltl]|uniref:Uncharacterized protein n=1 Tax=Pleurodeles waltl TaxID=8319 RepID=A0AAV7UZ85_PLEWA|nr:hypothetical protein NDU88_003696 [Pleurodeles waltl]
MSTAAGVAQEDSPVGMSALSAGPFPDAADLRGLCPTRQQESRWASFARRALTGTQRVAMLDYGIERYLGFVAHNKNKLHLRRPQLEFCRKFESGLKSLVCR